MKKIAKLMAGVLCLCLLLASCGGGSGSSSNASTQSGGNSDITSQTPSGTTSTTNTNPNLFDTDVWQAVPMVSQSILNNGYKGGEGCQWPNYAVFDPVDGKLAFVGADIGGTFRSTDGGITWEPSSIGLTTGGSVAVAIDPNNTKRVLLVGSGEGAGGENSGVFISTDAGVTWNHSKKAYLSRVHDYRNMIAFDKTSKNSSVGGSAVAYWLTNTEDEQKVKQHKLQLGLHKTTDGGKTWTFVSGTDKFVGGWLEVDAKGRVFISNSTGIYRSTDGGKSFKQIYNQGVNCIEVITSKPDYVYALSGDGLMLSTNGGDSFSKVGDAPSGAIRNFTYLAVSPADPNRMVMQNDTLTNNKDYALPSYYSHDGGKTWEKSTLDYTNLWAPANPRQRFASFHPTNKNIVLSLGSDVVMRSTDGGKNYVVSSAGYNVMMGTGIAFNINNPKLVSISAQDYNGGYSTDGGKTWNYVNWLGTGWGGHAYGTYPLTDKVVIAIASTAWRSRDGAEQYIAVTYDGGKTVTKTDYKITGSMVALGAKGNNNIAFIGEYRTTDGAKTFEKMNGCTGVFEIDAATGWLFGVNGKDIVMSKDNGATWKVIFQNAGTVNSICYNSVTKRVYFCSTASEIKYFKFDDSKVTNIWYSVTGVKPIWAIDCDPTNPNIMYAVGYSGSDFVGQNAWRSLDGGKTWTGLCRQAGDGRTGPDGANAASGCAVNPATRELFVISHCRGVWKIAPPPASAK